MFISRRREAKRRALLQMLDRIPVRSERALADAKRHPQPAAPAADLPLPPRSTPEAEPRAQK